MKRALIVNCSPVKTGATAYICALAESFLFPRYEIESVCIDDYDIAFCRGCRTCHTTARCEIGDDVPALLGAFARADVIVCVAPSYWADVPGQFKAFIDRCTPWSNTHEPHASVGPGKTGHAIALRTGSGRPELDKILETLFHFYGHLDIARGAGLALARVERRQDVDAHIDELRAFCEGI